MPAFQTPNRLSSFQLTSVTQMSPSWSREPCCRLVANQCRDISPWHMREGWWSPNSGGPSKHTEIKSSLDLDCGRAYESTSQYGNHGILGARPNPGHLGSSVPWQVFQENASERFTPVCCHTSIEIYWNQKLPKSSWQRWPVQWAEDKLRRGRIRRPHATPPRS